MLVPTFESVFVFFNGWRCAVSAEKCNKDLSTKKKKKNVKTGIRETLFFSRDFNKLHSATPDIRYASTRHPRDGRSDVCVRRT